MPLGKKASEGMRAGIVAAIKAEPTKPYRVIGEEFGLSEWFVCQLAIANGLQRPRGGVRKELTRQPRVWDCHAGKSYPADAVYVGCRVRNRKGGVIREGSIFGNGTNPLVSHHGSLNTESEFRAYAVEKLQDPAFRQQARQLKGRDLLCWCAQEGKRRAEFCHARVWLELINQEAL
jgi:Domain of unknown function (DUF4326)